MTDFDDRPGRPTPTAWRSASQNPSKRTHGAVSVVVMIAGGMHVAVLQLFFGRHPNLRDFDIEVQVLAGQRVIPIQGHHVALDLCHGDPGRESPAGR